MATQQYNITRERIEKAIMEFSPKVSLDSKATFDDVKSILRGFMRKHPEIFWFSHQYLYDENACILKFRYNLTRKKAEFFKIEIEKVVEDDFQIEYVKTLSEPERLVYVYKWIAKRTTYNEYSSFNQTIYSVLINRNSVCTGYAKTAQYLLGLVGIESQLVFGKFHSDKSEHGRHGWNIVKINGKWYHVDFCLADPTLRYLLNNEDSPIVRGSVLWNYFGVTTNIVFQNRSIEFIDTLPLCKDKITDIPIVDVLKPQQRLICCKSDSGASAKVYLDSFNKDRVIKVSRNEDFGLLQNEVKVLLQLSDCPHIIKTYELIDNGLVLEQLTPWSELLNSHYYNPTESDLRKILQQLIEGLIECRDKGISYSDIHYNNVFVTKDGIYKWGDFGIAFPLQYNGTLPSQMIGEDGRAKGSYWFMAPETYRQNIFTESSAIYSVAMMTYFVMNDMLPPFWKDEDHQLEALFKRLNGHNIPAPIFVDRFIGLWRIIQNTLNSSESGRPQVFEDFLRALDENGVTVNTNRSESDIDFIVDGNVEMPLLTVVDNESSVNHEFATTAKPNHKMSFEDHAHFTSTIGGRWGDGEIHDTDSFACTAVFPGNSKQQRSNQLGSYRPQKKSPTKIIKREPKRSIWNFWKRPDEREHTELEYYYGEDISTCVYAPAQIQPMKTFIVRVYLYNPEDSDAVDEKVRDIDPNAQKKEYKPLDIPVKEGDKLTVQLKMSGGVTLDNDSKTIIWRNYYTDCSFMAKLTNSSTYDVFGTVYISVNGIPAGELLFTIDVVESQAKNLYTKVESRRYSRIFISYSHADEVQVRGFAECCRAIGTDYFFDRHTLQAGDVFKEKILDYINNADLFVLCWSKNAAESEWVQIEREYALSLIKEGKTRLSIYPLSLKPEAPLPLDMSDKYNFGTL